MPAKLIIEQCDKVSKWAIGYAGALERSAGDEEDDQESGGSSGGRPGHRTTALAHTFHALAGHASTLAKLIEGHGDSIAEPQLTRLLHASQENTISYRPRIEADGGPLLVGSLAEITRPVARLIWLGTGTDDPAGSPWTALDLERLRACGIDMDDGGRALRALRSAERAGLRHVTGNLLTVTLPADEESRPHPVWLQAEEALSPERGEGLPSPLPIEQLIAGEIDDDISPWRLETETHVAEPPQPQRHEWTVDPALLTDRTMSSASSLTMRLSCPLQWVLHYRARLRASSIAGLPGSFLLKGSFCHQILEDVFGEGGTLPSESAARAAVKKRFDERLPHDAAPLAQPTSWGESLALRQELMEAAATLVKALSAGDYQVAAMEQKVSGEIAGRELIGYIDCLARRADGREAVIDFKYAGRKHHDHLAEGRAVQLATYAAARAQEAGVIEVAVAYLILCNSNFHTPEGSPLIGSRRGDIVEGAPAIDTVWNEFVEAVSTTDAWLGGGEPIPARPLQDPEEWPVGTELVVKEKEADRACMYCSFDLLCGRTELE